VKNPEFFDDAVRLISKNKDRITAEDTYGNNSDFGEKAVATDLYSKIEVWWHFK